MNQMQSMTALARPIDPKYFTNRLVLILTPITGVIAGGINLVQTGDLLQGIQAGFWMGVATFLSWMVSREVDLKYDYSAFVAMVITFVGMLVLPIPSIDVLAILVVMLTGRLLHRVVGVPATLVDSIVVLVFAALTTYFSSHWLVAIMLPVTLLLDYLLDAPVRRHLILSVVGFLIVGILAVVTNKTISLVQPDTATLFVIGVISVSFIATIIHTGKLSIPTDSGGECNVQRVQGAMVIALLVALISFLFFGINNYGMLPLWSILIATAIYRLGVILGLLRT